MCVRRTLRSMPWTKRICSAHHEIMAWADTVWIIYGLGKCEFTRNLKCFRWSLGVAGRENFCILGRNQGSEMHSCRLKLHITSMPTVLSRVLERAVRCSTCHHSWAHWEFVCFTDLQWKSIQEFCYVRTSTIRSFASMANVAVFTGTLL